MKIIQATEYYFPDVERGIERFVYELSKGLMAGGHNITVITGGRKQKARVHDMDVLYAPMYGKSIMKATRNLYDQRLTYVPSSLSMISRESPDIVHAHHFGGGYAASLIKMTRGIPYIMTVHVVPGASVLASPVPIYRNMYKKALLNAGLVVSVAGYVRDAVLKDFKIDSEVVPLSVDTQHFRPSPDRKELKRELGLPDSPVVLMVASLNDRRKRADMLISAMPRIKKTVRDAKLVLAGGASDEMLSYFRNLAEKHGVLDSTLFTGRLDEQTLVKYYAAADVFVLPSKEEAAGLVILEAMASGTPVVGSASGGIPEYVRDGKNGLLFNPECVDDLSDKISCILKDEKLMTDMGRTGRSLAVSVHSWEAAARSYSAIYERVVSKR